MSCVYVVRGTTKVDSYLLGVYSTQGQANARIKDVKTWHEKLGFKKFNKIWTEHVNMSDQKTGYGNVLSGSKFI
jgi:predicted oxidoreductase